ncbi:MAG TPA: SURF1 family protein [Mycobacteriales bacterium]|nr:SURF1 family protein [Mycobacteriales bacterium]
MMQTLRKPQYAVLLVIAVLVATGCSIAGVWQIHRYDWKRDTNHVLKDNNADRAVPVDRLLSTTRPMPKSLQFREVTATGRYEPAGQLLVRNREVDGNPALLVVTPLRTGAATLLVVRGYVPLSGPATQSPKVPAPPAGPVTVRTRLYPSEPPTAASGLPTGQINRINARDIGDRLGVPTYQAYAELTKSSAHSSLPQLPPPDMSNPAGGAFQLQHLAYVGQWFCFAIIALAAPFILAWIEERRLAEPRPRERDALMAELADSTSDSGRVEA